MTTPDAGGLAGWRPIDDRTPRDRTAFLAYFPGSVGFVARQDVKVTQWTGWGGGCWEGPGHKAMIPGPTH
jgi:hypothetical protein